MAKISFNNGITNIELEVEIVLLTPALSKKFLAQNYGKNRNIKPGYLRQLQGVLTRGEFIFNGEPLIFDVHGNLINGQHRCYGVINTGVPIPVLIVRGITDGPAAYMTIDHGSKRTLSDYFPTYATVLAPAARFLHAYEFRGKKISGASLILGVQDRPSDKALYDFVVNSHPDLVDSARYVGKRTGLVNIGLQKSICCFAHYIFMQKDTELADRMFDQLATGEGFKSAKESIAVLRRTLITRLSKRDQRRFTEFEQTKLLFTCFNDLTSGKEERFIYKPRTKTASGHQSDIRLL